MQINILEAKSRLSELIKSAVAGEEVVIANRGEPLVRLVPMQAGSSNADEAHSNSAILDWLEAHPLPPHRMRSHAEIEAHLTQERAAWD